jgi:hypothetical protein
MIYNWTNWKTFPDPRTGAALEAHIGPGVYEVRHSVSGRVLAFGSTSNVARSLSELAIVRRVPKGFAALFQNQVHLPRPLDLEYRTCAVSSRAEARGAARRLLGVKQKGWHDRLTAALRWQRAG